jgi:hypothetical protein
MKGWRLSLVLMAILMPELCAQQEPPPAPQPIAFSHKTHAGLAIKCLDCHAIRPPGFEASIPPEATCMGCHTTMKTGSPEIKRLAEFYDSKKPVPWVRVYRVPDFVWFSHEVHYRRAKIECDRCHGPVAERDVIFKEKPITMVACVECHEKNKARIGCNTCHDIH